MKNVFFALAFMLIGTFAFANNAEVETLEENVAIENVLTMDQASLDAEMDCGFPVYYDDGGSGDWGGSGSFWMDSDGDTTIGDIVDLLLALFF